MRILGRSLLLLCLLLLSWLTYSVWLEVYQTDHLDLATPYPNAVTERHDVYLLSTSQPKVASSSSSSTSLTGTLSFQLDQRIERLQIAAIPLFPISDAHPDAFNKVNVDIMREQISHPKYAIAYTLLDENNNTLSHETYWFNAKPSPWTIQEGNTQQDNTLIPEIFLSDANYFAGTRQSIYLRMENWPTARKIQLHLHHQPREIDGASVYVRQHFNRTKEEIITLWRKLSDNKRTRYTQNVHMYPHYIWSSNEIDSLLSNYWQQLGPEGVVGKDFTTLGLYRVAGVQPPEKVETTNSALPSSTLLTSEYKNLTFPIHTLGEVQLSFRPLQASAAGKIFTLTLHPEDASPPIIIQQVINQTTTTWKGILQKGLLELSSVPILEIEFQKMPDELSSDHKKHFKRYFLVSADKPLTYPIEHWRGQATPVKIELRAIINQPGLVTAKNADVNAVWLTTDSSASTANEKIKNHSHRLSLDYQVSRYEHLSGAKVIGTEIEVTNSVSEAKPAYYLAPETVKNLKITSTSPVLVQVSTRPLELPLHRKVPTHNRAWFDDESYLPTWFTLPPKQHHALINQEESIMLLKQHRPLLDRYAAQDEEFTAEQIPPNQAQSNLNQILVPVNNEDKLMAASPTSRYRQFMPSTAQIKGPMKLNFLNNNSSRSLSPSLVFQGDYDAPREVNITLDNQSIDTQWITGHWGKITLPQINKGFRSLSVSSKSENWLVNQVGYEKGSRYFIQKDAYSLNKKNRISYNINKTSAETLLNFTYYNELTNNPAQDSLLEVKLLKTAPQQSATMNISSSMTIPIRHWRLVPDHTSKEQGLMLNRGHRKTNSGTHFVYSLGDDLPLGEYQIQFSLIEGSEGYLNVSRLIPKPGIEIDYFRESIHAY